MNCFTPRIYTGKGVRYNPDSEKMGQRQWENKLKFWSPDKEIPGYTMITNMAEKLATYTEAQYITTIDYYNTDIEVTLPALEILKLDFKKLCEKYPKACGYMKVLDMLAYGIPEALQAQKAFVLGWDWEKALVDLDEAYRKAIIS
jgi:hypothetical protein